MKESLKNYLFTKQILVADADSGINAYEDEAFYTVVSLAKLFNVKITKGRELCGLSHIKFISEKLGENVPLPFYKGFPKSVLELSFEERCLDQLVHYYKTYGMGDFENPSHSIFEESFERRLFTEEGICKCFTVLKEDEAVDYIKECATLALASTRPLNDFTYNMVLDCIMEYGYEVKECPCKDTAIRLLLDLRDCGYARFISFSDVLKLVEYINIFKYKNTNVRKLNWCNQDRKLVKSGLDCTLEQGECNIKECFEKRDRWCGLLHHIHYKPKNELGERFVKAMREGTNNSTFSHFENEMAQGKIKEALMCLKEGKGSGAVIRNLDYLLSRCENQDDVDFVLENMDTSNTILLLQLYIHYINYVEKYGRVFRFTRNGTLIVHKEIYVEYIRRKSFVDKKIRVKLIKLIRNKLEGLYANTLGNVYIHESMRKIALPLQEGTAQGGLGILPKGSRVQLPEGNFIRAFTYWEKVDDIDLSVFGLSEDGTRQEFSWRTMARESSKEIAYSGDIIDGYKGGSEYFDIDIKAFKERFPQVHYLVFCNNVYSRIPFKNCICKAGYMMREDINSGEIFEPKSVASSFAINCDSMFAYLFAIDLRTNELVWLNIANSLPFNVAGKAHMDFLYDYLDITEVINVYDLFEMKASRLTSDMANADVVVTDEEIREGMVKEGAVVIRGMDVERIMAEMG